MKWLAAAVALVAVVGLIVGWRATEQHPKRPCVAQHTYCVGK